MKTGQRRFDDASQETGQDEKHLNRAEFTREMPKSLTTWDFIGLVALTVLQPVLFLGQQTDDDNRQENQGIDKKKE